jgi:hypothetical protein
MLNKMVGFVTTTAPERSSVFYGDTLGFRFIEDDGFALAFDANGTLLRVAKAQSFTPSQATVLGTDAVFKRTPERGRLWQALAGRLRTVQPAVPGPGRARHLDRAQRRPRRLVQGPGRQHPVDLSLPSIPTVSGADRLRELTALLESIAEDRRVLDELPETSAIACSAPSPTSTARIATPAAASRRPRRASARRRGRSCTISSRRARRSARCIASRR